jgi:hypothetical protein
MSRRGVVLLTWLAASAVPFVLAVVLVGCCALPFHGLVHRLLPLCAMAETALTVHQEAADGHEHPATPPQKNDDHGRARPAVKPEPRTLLLAALPAGSLRALPPSVVLRSQLSPGAFRCDDDVGTRLARLDTLRL